MEGHRNYAKVYRENSILTASPGQLVLLMFDGALRSMALAHIALERPPSDFRRIEVVNRELLKAQAILSQLRGSLNREAGGEFAKTMDGLYAYYNRRLMEANMSKDVTPLAEVEQLLKVVRDAWAEMLRTQDVSEPSVTMASA
jgi:flagellar protein FliS